MLFAQDDQEILQRIQELAAAKKFHTKTWKLSRIIFPLALKSGMKKIHHTQKQGPTPGAQVSGIYNEITPRLLGHLEGLDCHLVVKMCITVQSEGPPNLCLALSHFFHDTRAYDIFCHAPIR